MSAFRGGGWLAGPKRPEITVEHIQQAAENLRRRDAAPYAHRAFWQGFWTAMVPMLLMTFTLAAIIMIQVGKR